MVGVRSRALLPHSDMEPGEVVKGLSPRYASPEVFARMHLRRTVHTVEDDQQADVYAMGVVIWETMTRQARSMHLAPALL